MRLGFVAKSVAHPELKCHDGRRWQNHPHLSVSLAYLRDMFAYLATAGVDMYRLSPELAPYANHPELPEFRNQVDECGPELRLLGARARVAGLRLSIHSGQHVVINSPDPDLANRSAADLVTQASILDSMTLGPEAVVIVHLGGIYEDRAAALARFSTAYAVLPVETRRRLVLENDDVRFGVSDLLHVHEQTGIRLVFDYLHHRLNNPTGMATREALAACLATWPEAEHPKIHFSSPRTELNLDPRPGGSPPHVRPPQWRNHSDYVNPFEFIDFLRAAGGLRAFDVMLEAGAKDLALLQLRRDLSRFAPDLVASLDLRPGAGPNG